MVHRNRWFTVLKNGGSFHGELLNNQMVTFNMMELDWIWGKYGCAVVAADGCIYAPPYNARQAWGKSYCARHAKHGWTWIWSFNGPHDAPTYMDRCCISFRFSHQRVILWSCPWIPPKSPKSLLLVKAADSADFGEGRNQPETLRFCDPWTPWTPSFPAVAAVRLSALTPYHLVMTNSLPWEDPPFLRTANHLFLWTIYTMANC